MNTAQTLASTPHRTLRLWPGVAGAALGWLLMVLVPLVAPAEAVYGVLGGLVGGLLVVVWWLFFSRAPWSERVGAIVLMVAATFALKRLVHESLAGAGMGMGVYIYAVPGLTLALVAGAVASRHLTSGARRTSIVAAILLACGVMLLLRIDGISLRGGADFQWRWTPTVEERLLARAREEPAPGTARSAPAVVESAPATADTSAPAAEPSTTVADAAVDGADTVRSAAGAAPPTGKVADAPLTGAVDRSATPSAAPPPAPKEAVWPGFRGPERDGVYGSDRAIFAIDPPGLLEGHLSPRALGLITEWAALHRDELLTNWSLARHQEPLRRIAPLE